MPVIGQRVFILPPSTDTFVSLAGEEFARQFDLGNIGNNWSRIRLAINCAIADTGGGNLTNTKLQLGLCSGTAFPACSQQCLNAVGMVYGGNVATWTYNAGSGNPYYTVGTFNMFHRKGVTDTTSSVGSPTFAIPTNAGALARRGWLEVQIYQATLIGVGGFSNTAAVCASDVYYDQYIYSLSQNMGSTLTVPTVLNAASAGVFGTVAPGAGWNSPNPLNAINIYWSNTTYKLEIYAIAIIFG